ncbi:MAG: zinc-binding dehydrogenase [Spirochaetales bacterium]|nr:zinc-binding dehydrogenase [Spirochaetales bacterium]
MITKAVRLHGKMDLRLEEFELPPLEDDQLLVKVISVGLSRETYKAAVLGTEHLRVPDNAAINPVIVGHELAGEIVEVGAQWEDKYRAGERFTLWSPAGRDESGDCPGFSYTYCGGDTQYAIIPPEVIQRGGILPYKGEGFYRAALTEALSRTIGACRSLFRTDRKRHAHYLGIKDGGRMAIIGGCGPVGLAAVDYALSGEFRPKQLIVTDIDEGRIERARKLFGQKAQRAGISLMILNREEFDAPRKTIMELTDNEGFDDLLVLVPTAGALELGESMLARGGCMNFSVETGDRDLSVPVNFYDLLYGERHIIGTDWGNMQDMREALELMEEDKIGPEVLITHIGGLDAAAEATLNIPGNGDGKNLIYTDISLPLTALDELEEKGKGSDFYRDLAGIVKKNNGLWSVEAESYLLQKAEKI